MESSIILSLSLLYFLIVLSGALILLTSIGNSSKMRAIIHYEIPILLLYPLASHVISTYVIINDLGAESLRYTIPFVLAAICASASALLPGRKSLIFGTIGAFLVGIPLFSAYLLFLCILGFILDIRAASDSEHPAFAEAEAASKTEHPVFAEAEAAPDTGDIPTTAPDKKKRIINKTEQKFKPGPAIRRAIIGAAIGAAAMAILFIAIGGNLSNILYGIFCGSLYGFGFAFADTQKLRKNTKKAAVEGTAGFGIGILISRVTDNKKWGMYGSLYFIFRIIFALMLGWIPGIWYGIQAIRAELKEASVSVPTMNVPKRSASTVTPAEAPVVPKSAAISPPVLYCLSGMFAGAELPLNKGEVITLGSDPSCCQLVLTEEGINPQHCQVGFDNETSRWYAIALSNSTVYRDQQIRALNPGAVTFLPQGTVLSMGQSPNSPCFRLG